MFFFLRWLDQFVAACMIKYFTKKKQTIIFKNVVCLFFCIFYQKSKTYKGAFTLDTSDPHHIDPHQFDPHQRVHTIEKDNPHQIDPHQLDPHQFYVHTRRKNVMRINLIHNRFANWKTTDININCFYNKNLGIDSTCIAIFLSR